MIRVMFVCLGNICRSPMAEAIFANLIQKEGLTDRIEVESAGTGAWHIGKPPHKKTIAILKKYEIPTDGLVAQQITPKDKGKADYFIAMDEENKQDLLRMFGENDKIRIAKLMDFVKRKQEENVPDPYFTGNFSYTYELVTEGCYQLLQYLKQKHAIQ
ncbi:low molecular weight protein-tyrosine-phosphatase [Virgibacillus sp. Bac330]|uniref:low molecular weight protein-tyrosine-phosphatase n=1 Tax=Virgibacillus sp. Bac330 TaxID=2419841 RepID=UPI000EF467E4|nr:low molecular weight protein-tyrosine-phosphatase [Virgibacillus sp. Bac330]